MATVTETRIRLACPAADRAGPWPLTTVITDLRAQGLQTTDRFRALGSGRSAPLIHSQSASWAGLPVELEAVVDHRPDRPAEVSLVLPSHDELSAGGVHEEAFWALVDACCDATRADHGALVDGEAMALERPRSREEWDRRFRRHFCLLVPDDVADHWKPAAAPHRVLPLSGLVVVLR